MALNKVARTKLGKFGSITKAGHAKADNSIFGKNACNTLCSFKDSFSSLSMGDNSAFDIFSEKGKENLDREIDIITGQDKNKDKPAPKVFTMNEKSLAILQQELGETERRRVTLSS